ncbi:hypothetical protein K7X08_001715 [Anisodus acutangulus]|uniref:F-box protein At3g26010-like beta-propeller domain-containing protein n=1 Tax=Anisodus acutangulus TaxID=402998 RepID=A0A9Q1LPA0_9SOLA|nr:hypothetical protein K7X08_001715 [Anisodus acutangulus]
MGFFCQGRDDDPLKIHFFFSSRKSSEIVDGSLDESDNFVGRGVYINASSNDFILIADDLENQGVYYVYNPATRQHLAVPVTQTSCISVAAIGFHCKVDDLEKDVISFTILRFEHSFDLRSSVTIESFSSDTNAWTTSDLVLDVPISVSIFSWAKVASLGVIDGVFCWIDMDSHVILYDSVNRRFWALELTEEIENKYVEALGVSGGALYYAIILYDSVNRRFWALQLSNDMVDGDARALGVSGGALYYALCVEAEITVWFLESNIRSQDAVRVRKYAADITSDVLDCLKAFGLSFYLIKTMTMSFHPEFRTYFI